MNVLTKATVLVLNRNWQAINVRTPQEAFCMMATNRTMSCPARAVGVDITCRMKMTVLDIPAGDLERHQDRLTRANKAETRFGGERAED